MNLRSQSHVDNSGNKSPARKGKNKKITPKKSRQITPQSMPSEAIKTADRGAESEQATGEQPHSVDAESPSQKRSERRDSNISESEDQHPDISEKPVENDDARTSELCKQQRALKNVNPSIFLFGILGAIVVICLSLDGSDVALNSDNSTKLERFQASFMKIRSLFPSQNSRLWQISRLALETNLKSTENAYPAVLMLLSTKQASSTMQCLAAKLSDAFSLTCGKGVKVNGSKFGNNAASEVKHEIDRTITNGHAEGACSVVVSRFDAIPPFATTTFFQYCENDNAPFKNFAVIFTVQVDDGKWNEEDIKLSGVEPSQWDRLANDFLKWSLISRDSPHMTDENVSALLSRITSSVVWVKQEEKEISC